MTDVKADWDIFAEGIESALANLYGVSISEYPELQIPCWQPSLSVN